MRKLMAFTAALLSLGLVVACDQRQETNPPPSAETTPNVTINPPDNVTVVSPQPAPNVTINPPAVNAPTSRESTTVTVPGVGSTTTTTERR